MIVISDTSVITNLASVECLSLLPQLYGQIIIPLSVYRELTDISMPMPRRAEVQNATWMEIRQVENQVMVEQLHTKAKLDLGESEAIALALEMDADLLLIDERRGRLEADRLGVKIVGLLGLLVEAKRNSLIVAVKPIIDDLIQMSAFRVSLTLYEQILRMVNEWEATSVG